MTTTRALAVSILLLALAHGAAGDERRNLADPPQFSGIYPHLAHFNTSNECGTGAVVPWADRLWVITYSPHRPGGSDDKLYEIDATLNRTTRPESVGGTPANRMIHRESGQLFIGPYAIDRQRNVRAISASTMFGRLTGNARHLTDPANKIYYATMEEGFYEVDVHNLKVNELYPDANRPGPKQIAGALLPGYHGKGLYSGQGRLIYANNGEHSSLARSRPDIASGVLASWDGEDWTTVRRNQFTEVTGPGGLYGNVDPEHDPVWSIGWDHRSLILMLLDRGKWHAFRLPKATHTYDGAHGWNTEWPRIRDIGQNDLLMTMHGMFWRFPRNFRRGQTAGIAPRSTYLKVIADFCHWNDRLVFGCDDAAKSEFLNKSKAKGTLAGPGQSQSNLWFAQPDQIDHLGRPIGRGAVWVADEVRAGVFSEAFLFAGFQRRGVHLTHDAKRPVTFRFEVDRVGNGRWTPLRQAIVAAEGYRFIEFSKAESGAWVRISADRDCRATAWFEFSNADDRPSSPDARFEGLAFPAETNVRGGLLRAGKQSLGLQVLATQVKDSKSRPAGYYELSPKMTLRRVDSPEQAAWMAKNVALTRGVVQLDEASAIYVDQQGKRFRLPVGNPAYFRRPELMDLQRTDREVCTERDLFQCAGTFFELPARNAGGFAKIRPIATHPCFVQDYCSWRGMLVLTGSSPLRGRDNNHFVRSEDGQCSVWLGTVDDLWKLGKATGRGGPWKDTPVKAGAVSDPYLMAGYDRKTLTLSHNEPQAVTFDVQLDITGTGSWQTYQTMDVPAGEEVVHRFPAALNAYWVRLVSSADAIVTAQLRYE